jgi:uncharacterized protein HemX
MQDSEIQEEFEDERRKRLPLIAALASVFMIAIALGAALTYGFLNRDDVERNCAAALKVRDAVVLSYRDAASITKNTPVSSTTSQKQLDQAAQFYDRNIKQLMAVHCAGR